ncbi:hypothetical protein NQZ68_014806 [Xyrichtys novacula]|uniref:Uncharacterized protein n=1 Tax=Xyrichtys novacula TaxID=13765 RepID=A0AAV1G5S8_XYRNO|nr:hypothetical protein NQZ68_014806 [Xyrichtys novacula]
MCRKEPIPRTGIYTPIISAGMALGQLIMDMAPAEHPASMLQIFLHLEMFTLSKDWNDQQSSLTGVRIEISSRCSSVLQVSGLAPRLLSFTQRTCQKQPQPIRALVTVKDEGACGRTGTVPWKPATQAAASGPSTELCGLATAPLRSSMSGLGKKRKPREEQGRLGRLANCRAKV